MRLPAASCINSSRNRLQVWLYPGRNRSMVLRLKPKAQGLTERSKWKRPLIAASVSLLAIAGLSAFATQHIAARLGYDPALGPPLWHVYPPFDWIRWRTAPWAQEVRPVFWSIDLGMPAILAVIFVGALIASHLGKRPKRHTDVHGTAKFLGDRGVRESGLMSGGGGVYVGAWRSRDGVTHYLRHDGPEHIAAIAPTRSGKGVGLVIPTLLSWPDSAVIFDEKAELWAMTSGWRKSIGQAVIRWNPGDPAGSAKFNFLAEVRVGTLYEVADAQNIAVMIIDPEGRGFKDHWDRTAFGLLTGVILHVIYKVRTLGREASLPDVARALSDPRRPADALYAEMAGNTHLAGSQHPAVAAAGREQMNREDRERSAVLSTATTYMQLFRDPIVAMNSESSDFRINDLANADRPVSLYMLTPGSDKIRLRPLVRLMITLIIRTLTGAPINIDANGHPIMPHKHKLLLMFDEFPSFGRLAVFEDALAKIAGFGIKAVIIMQDREQLIAAYHQNETILSNAHVRIAYAPNKYETALWISQMLGTSTVNLEMITESGTRGWRLGHVSRSVSQVSRPLMTPDEVMQLPGPKKKGALIVAPGEVLIFIAGMAPIRGRQILYFEDPVFLERSRIPAPALGDSLTHGRRP